MFFIKREKNKVAKKWWVKIICVFLAIIAWCVFTLCANTNFVESTTDILKYYKNIDSFDVYQKEYNCKEKLVVFPRELKESYQINQYYYAKVSQFFNTIGKHFILDITFNNAEDYGAEIDRLKNVEITHKKDDENVTVKLLYSEELLHYPAYIATYYLNDYEYALILDNAQIMYIYVDASIEYSSLDKKLIPFLNKRITPLSDEYLPDRYFEQIYFSNLGFTYNVYMNLL